MGSSLGRAMCPARATISLRDLPKRLSGRFRNPGSPGIWVARRQFVLATPHISATIELLTRTAGALYPREVLQSNFGMTTKRGGWIALCFNIRKIGSSTISPIGTNSCAGGLFLISSEMRIRKTKANRFTPSATLRRAKPPTRSDLHPRPDAGHEDCRQKRHRGAVPR